MTTNSPMIRPKIPPKRIAGMNRPLGIAIPYVMMAKKNATMKLTTKGMISYFAVL